MINFILYQGNNKYNNLYKSLITNYIGSKSEKYKIIDISNDNLNYITDSLDGKKIFLLDNDNSINNLIDIAKHIRNNGDWLSPIIIFTNLEDISNYSCTQKILMIDFIAKDNNLKENFIDSIRIAHNIVKTHKSFTFQYNGEIYNIPYHNILYFEKDLNNNYTNIVTKNKIYKVKKSLTRIETDLNNDCRFIKTHRSYIVNIHNIDNVNLNTSIINFKNGKTALISRSKKKFIRECLRGLMVDN